MADRKFYLGMGSSSGATFEELLSLAEEVLVKGRCFRLDGLATLNIKSTDPLWVQLANHYGCQLHFFNAFRLEEEAPRLKNPSEAVFKAIGCHGVAEAAALAAAGPDGFLVVEKMTLARATAALAIARVI